MGFSTEPIRQIGWFERYPDLPCSNHQPINSDALEGAIRNPIQQEEVVGRACSGSVCSLRLCIRTFTRGPHVDGFGIPILKSIKEFENVLRRPTNNGSTVVNEHRALKQVGLGLQKCLDVGGSLEPRHDFFSGVL